MLCVVAGVPSTVPRDPATALVEAAREQVGVTVRYDGSYRRLPYPGGDVPADRGVCTDVLVRAYRRLGIDLQRLVHEDVVAAPAAYLRIGSRGAPDRNIDHRRVRNLVVFFTRHGRTLPLSGDPRSFRPGDLVTWRLPSGLGHIGIVSDRTSPSGVPLVIHNIGRGTLKEDILLVFTITGHFRYPPLPPASGRGEGA